MKALPDESTAPQKLTVGQDTDTKELPESTTTGLDQEEPL